MDHAKLKHALGQVEGLQRPPQYGYMWDLIKLRPAGLTYALYICYIYITSVQPYKRIRMIYAFKSAPATDEFCWYIGTSGGPIANIQLKSKRFSRRWRGRFK